MTDRNRIQKSLWEHAGFPGVPNYHQEHTTESVDLVFKKHLDELRADGTDTAEVVESVLSWSVLRDDGLREKLRYYYDYGVLNQATNREAGPGELLDYHNQVDQIEREAAADAAEMLANGATEKEAAWAEQRTAQRRHDEESVIRRPSLPDATETWPPALPGVKALGWSAAWTGLTFALVVLAHVLGVGGFIADFLLAAPWVGLAAGLAGFGASAWIIHGRYVSLPISRNKWLGADTRGNWPVLVWSFLTASVFAAFPLWVGAAWIPVSAGLPLLYGPFRRRLLESVGGVNGPMLEAGELLGREPEFGPNVFVPANSTIQADAPAMDVTLPIRLRDGSPGQDLDGVQEGLLNLADHAGVKPSGLADDVHKVIGALLLDALVGATGSDDLRLVAQYGSGPMKVASKAAAVGLGQDLLTLDSAADAKPGRAVAPWFAEEAAAYQQFVEKHLCSSDAKMALTATAQILADAVDEDFPHLARYRLETIAYALTYAGSSFPSSA